MTYEQWSKEWLENYVRPAVKDRTYIRYRNLLRFQILPALGKMELDSMSPLILQQFVSGLIGYACDKTGKGLSANTVNSSISVLKNSLRIAYEAGVTDMFYAGRIKRPKRDEKKAVCFSMREQRLLQEKAREGKRKFIGVIVCLYSGLRIGEVLALKWSDINFRQSVLIVNKTCYDVFGEGKNHRYESSAKTYSSNRIIPIPTCLKTILKEYKKTAKSEFVVENDNGEAVGVRSYQRSFELLQRKCKIVRRNFHALRHTFATRAIECGMDVKTLSEILGHKNSTITLNRYIHSLTAHKRTMMNRMSKLFK